MRNTAIRGIQIKDGEVTETQLNVSVNASLDLADTALQTMGAFTSLTDVPANYTDSALKGVRVNAGANALEFYTITDNVGIVAGDIYVDDLTGSADTTPAPLTETPVASSVQVYLNGLLQEEGSGKDYTISAKQITFAVATEVTDIIIVHYIKA